MPLYEYRCSKGHITEKIRPVSKRGLSIPCGFCPRLANKIFSTFNFQFSQFLQELSAGTII